MGLVSGMSFLFVCLFVLSHLKSKLRATGFHHGMCATIYHYDYHNIWVIIIIIAGEDRWLFPSSGSLYGPFSSHKSSSQGVGLQLIYS